MRFYEKGLIALSGHSANILNGQTTEERVAVQKMGWLVLVAMFATGISWGIAGTFYGATETIGLIAAVVGAIIVLILDRDLIYNMDTGNTKGKQAFGYLFFRLGLVLIVSSLTSTAVTPYFLQAEMATYILKEKDRQSEAKQTFYEKNAHLAVQQAQVTQHQANIERLQTEKQQLPLAIQTLQTSSNQCWASYHQQIRQAVTQGKSQTKAKKLAKTKGIECRKLDNQVKAQTIQYQGDKEHAIQTESNQLSNAQQRVTETNAKVDSQMQTAKAALDLGITSQSQTALWAFLLATPAALAKWAMITAFWLLLELLPILSKLMQRQTIAGQRIQSFNHLESLRIDSESQQMCYEIELANNIRSMTLQSAAELVKSPSYVATSAQVLASFLQSMTSYEAVMILMRQVSSFEEAKQQFQRRYPQHSELIAQAMSNAANDAAHFMAQHQA